jgi:hypothetical protein
VKGFIEINTTNGIDGLSHKRLIALDQIEEVGIDNNKHAYMFLKGYESKINIHESYDEIKRMIKEAQGQSDFMFIHPNTLAAKGNVDCD